MNLRFRITSWKYLLNEVIEIERSGNGTNGTTLKNDEREHYPTSIDTPVDPHFKDSVQCLAISYMNLIL